MKKQALETKHFIENQEREERKLLKIIAEADAESLRQKREIDQVGIAHLAFQTRYILFPRLSSVFLRWRSEMAEAAVNVVLLKLCSAVETKMLRYWSEWNT